MRYQFAIVLCCLLPAACGYIEEGNLLLAPGTSGATADGFLLTSGGETISEGALAHDFGSLPTNTSATPCSFTLANDSIIELELGGVGISDCDSFSLALTNPGSLAPGASFGFAVRFRPCLATNLQATVWLSNADNSAPILSFRLCGTGLDTNQPWIVSSTPTNNGALGANPAVELNFSETVTGAEETGNYSLSGAGVGSLSVSSVTDLGGNSYRLALSGSPGVGNINLSCSGINDDAGNPVQGLLEFRGWWNTAWQRRIPITIDNSGGALSQYQVRIDIGPAAGSFWDGIENDGASLRIVDSDNSSLLSHYLDSFDHGSAKARVYVKVTNLIAASQRTIYLYYGNGSASSTSSGSDTFFFYDDFEDGDISDWQQYSNGSVQHSLDGGNHVLLKTDNSDPHGGYRPFSASISEFEAIFRTKRINENGGAANRYGIEDASFNGYGPQYSSFSGSPKALIERRSSGSGTTISAQGSPAVSANVWYIVYLRRYGNNLECDLYDEDGNLLDSRSATDANYSSFDRFVVHGGYEFLTDDIRIRHYVDPEPVPSLGSAELQ